MRTTLFLSLAFLLYSCLNEKKGNITIVDTEAGIVSPINLSEVFFEAGNICLETTSPLINRVSRVIKTRKNIFVADVKAQGARLLLFDSSGHFIRQIGSFGHGPGEYYYFSNFAVDTNSNVVYIASFDQLLSFNFEGKFIRSTPINSGNSVPFLVDYMTCIESQLWSFQKRMLPPKSADEKWIYLGELIRYNEQLQVIDTTVILKSFLDINQMSSLPLGTYCLSKLGDKTYVYYPISNAEPLLRDTLYELRSFKKVPAFKLDFSEILSVDKSINLKSVNLMENIDAILKIRNIMIYNIYRTQKHVFVEYNKDSFSNEYYLFCYDLNQKKRYNMKEGFTDDLYNTGIAAIKPSDLRQGEFYFIKDGFEVEGIADGVNESSNPVIFFVRTR